jgi:hypothetical protein
VVGGQTFGCDLESVTMFGTYRELAPNQKKSMKKEQKKTKKTYSSSRRQVYNELLISILI